MKTKQLNFSIFYQGYIFLIACILTLPSLAAPPDYDFRNPTLLSGTNLQVNARYRFSNVKSGVDAIVTIMAFSGGVTLNQMDGPTGYAEALQPVIFAPANSNGYVEFRIQFVTAGTLAGVAMPQVSSTSLDIDGTLSGTGNLFEYDMVSLNSATSVYNYDMSTTELTMSSSGGWVTGRNVTGTNYSGVDTSAKNVMFTVTNYNASSFRVRMGTQNGSTSGTTRNKSVYFANFEYNNGLLAKNPLVDFAGNNDNARVWLQWQTEKSAEIGNISVEKCIPGGQFSSIARYTNLEIADKNSFQLSDWLTCDKAHYRLKVDYLNGSVSYSKVLTFYSAANAAITMSIYLETRSSVPCLIVSSMKETPAKLLLVDLAGNIKYVKNIYLQKGKNNFRLDSRGLLIQGYHAAIIEVDKTIYSKKF
jgi:hypothetical protein